MYIYIYVYIFTHEQNSKENVDTYIYIFKQIYIHILRSICIRMCIPEVLALLLNHHNQLYPILGIGEESE
jgi:hypothetical protein